MDAYLGSWILDESKSESLGPILEAQGVGWAKRKVIENLSQTNSFSVDGDKVTIKVTTKLSNKESTFVLGADFVDVEEDVTGLMAKRKAYLDGDKLVLVSKNENGEVVLTRSIEGNVLKAVAVLTKPDGSTITTTRHFNKQ
jgi:hypothetical protein